jgi:hypothetical protein
MQYSLFPSEPTPQEQTAGKMQYSSFIPSQPTPQEQKAKDAILQKEGDELIQSFGEVIKLKSDYFNCATYFYSREEDIIYEFVHERPVSILSRGSKDDLHIRALNETLISNNASTSWNMAFKTYPQTAYSIPHTKEAEDQ